MTGLTEAQAAAQANAPNQGFLSSADRIVYTDDAKALYMSGVVDTTGTGTGNLASIEDLSPLFAQHKDAARRAAAAAGEGANAIETPLSTEDSA